MKLTYKVGDRVRVKSLEWYNQNKNKSGVVFLSGLNFTEEMAVYCGKVVTIDGCLYGNRYFIVGCGFYTWNDEMFDGLAEEEIVLKGCTQGETPGMGTVRVVKVDKTVVALPENVNKSELVVDKDCKIVTENNKMFLVRKKPDLPKTYDECCNILGAYQQFVFKGIDEWEAVEHTKLIMLRRCRNAYWKLANDWKPDWIAKMDKYTITTWKGRISLDIGTHHNQFLVFPTKKMRDEFYSNFKSLIEECKEFL